MITPITHDTVVDALVGRLRDDILGGVYPPGSYLPAERELAVSYGITRTSLKHAMVRLVQAGLLETRHGVGTRVLDYERFGGAELLPMLVSTLGPQWMAEIFDARREVGALVAAQAAGNAGPEDHERLWTLLEELRTAPTPSTAQLTECEIHRVVAAATGNRVYAMLVNTLLSAYMEVREAFQRAFEDPAATAAWITPVITAICAGNADGARAAAQAYLRRTEQLMLAPAPEKR
ncbi:FadR/GntR family transcriptional regulator [Actinomadura scrupuli]|uniref:FadR/GntR family transcriptional regulator n=1 Tax=Actinomadura scrupuli TaxID=559629 RepID=UPI003D973D9B